MPDCKPANGGRVEPHLFKSGDQAAHVGGQGALGCWPGWVHMQLQPCSRLGPLRFQMRGRRDDNHRSWSFAENHPRGQERKCRLASTWSGDSQKVRLAIAEKTTERRTLLRPKPYAL